MMDQLICTSFRGQGNKECALPLHTDVPQRGCSWQASPKQDLPPGDGVLQHVLLQLHEEADLVMSLGETAVVKGASLRASPWWCLRCHYESHLSPGMRHTVSMCSSGSSLWPRQWISSEWTETPALESSS